MMRRAVIGTMIGAAALLALVSPVSAGSSLSLVRPMIIRTSFNYTGTEGLLYSEPVRHSARCMPPARATVSRWTDAPH